MLNKHLRRHRNSLVGFYGAVGPYFHCKLALIGNITHAGIINLKVSLEYGRVNRVNGNNADNVLRRSVLLGGNIASALIKSHLHIELGSRVKSGYIHIGI